MAATLYAWRNGAAAPLTSEQQTALMKFIGARRNFDANAEVTFADDGASLTLPEGVGEDARILRLIALQVNSEYNRWGRGADPQIIISDSATPETLAELNDRHRAIAQG